MLPFQFSSNFDYMSPTNQVKPAFEKVSPEFGRSILARNHSNTNPNTKASWHFHPEVELVYVNKGQGKLHIGNHLSYFQNSVLVLIGANLPHHGFTDRLTNEGSETLIQFLPAVVRALPDTLPPLLLHLRHLCPEVVVLPPEAGHHVRQVLAAELFAEALGVRAGIGEADNLENQERAIAMSRSEIIVKVKTEQGMENDYISRAKNAHPWCFLYCVCF